METQRPKASPALRVIEDTVLFSTRRSESESLPKLLARQFPLWYRELEKMAAIDEWMGTNPGGEALTEEEFEEREELLFALFCLELKRSSMVEMSESEIIEGLRLYRET